MKLESLNRLRDLYKEHLKQPLYPVDLLQWEVLKNFYDHWDPESENFVEMFSQSLQSNISRRLWKNERYLPKEMMVRFIKMDADYVRFAFRDLYNEKYDVENRVDRFIFHCDELLRIYKKKNPLSIENNHYQDYSIISLYLALKYPEKYARYSYSALKRFLEVSGSLNLPKHNDIGRYFKILKTIDTILSKDEELIKIHPKRLDLRTHYTGKTIFMAADFIFFSSTQKL